MPARFSHCAHCARCVWRRGAAGALAIVVAVGLFGGCAPLDDEQTFIEDPRPVEVIYNSGLDEIAAGRYTEGSAEFETVERQYPYSVWAKRAILMAAYAYYRSSEYDAAILNLRRFQGLFPTDWNIPYVHYLLAQSFYIQITEVTRDQRAARQALAAFNDIVRRFPNTSYARDAHVKIDLALAHLAGREISVGRYYQERGEHIAAIKRFHTVVEDYDTTVHVPEALHRLTESWLVLGAVEEARMGVAYLAHNFRGSRWYAYSYALLAAHDALVEDVRAQALADTNADG